MFYNNSYTIICVNKRDTYPSENLPANILLVYSNNLLQSLSKA